MWLRYTSSVERKSFIETVHVSFCCYYFAFCYYICFHLKKNKIYVQGNSIRFCVYARNDWADIEESERRKCNVRKVKLNCFFFVWTFWCTRKYNKACSWYEKMPVDAGKIRSKFITRDFGVLCVDWTWFWGEEMHCHIEASYDFGMERYVLTSWNGLFSEVQSCIMIVGFEANNIYSFFLKKWKFKYAAYRIRTITQFSYREYVQRGRLEETSCMLTFSMHAIDLFGWE